LKFLNLLFVEFLKEIQQWHAQVLKTQ